MKSSARRTTRVGDDPTALVKVFHSPGLRRFGDGRRARRELDFLARLHGAGVSVPRPRFAHRGAGGWVLEMDRIPDAISLDDALEERASFDLATRLRIARSAGRVLAGVACAGVEHGDPHPGNFLVRPNGDVFLIDFARASRGRRFRPRAALRDLIAAAAAVRETTSPRERAVAFAAWLEAVPDAARAALPPRAELAASIERDARTHRLVVVARHLERWTRESGIARILHDGAERIVDVRGHGFDLDPRVPVSGDPGGFTAVGELEHYRAAPDDVRRTWLCAARLREHGIPTLQPVRTSPRGGWATFSLPAHGVARTGSASLAELLDDRGLAAPDVERHVAALADGTCYLRPTVRLGTRRADGGDLA